MNSIYEVIKRPCLTEKGMGLQESYNQIVVEVDRRANKVEIKAAMEMLFKVKVDKVRTASIHGKQKRVGRHTGQTSNWKKAIVTLAEGHKIDFVEGI